MDREEKCFIALAKAVSMSSVLSASRRRAPDKNFKKSKARTGFASSATRSLFKIYEQDTGH